MLLFSLLRTSKNFNKVKKKLSLSIKLYNFIATEEHDNAGVSTQQNTLNCNDLCGIYRSYRNSSDEFQSKTLWTRPFTIFVQI